MQLQRIIDCIELLGMRSISGPVMVMFSFLRLLGIRSTTELLPGDIVECDHVGKSSGEHWSTPMQIHRSDSPGMEQKSDCEVAKAPVGIFPISHLL